ncbi:unnamed protein product [Lymnaea stagnalis]|uniref:Uncharacterized protein n=1 Tax=Lymnaea stagnalis TaxID=6523 RepID=A0AAV2IEY4_LYMST
MTSRDQQGFAHSLSTSLELFYRNKVNLMMYDPNRPKGLFIYHDGLVSHVCAVNLNDGTTALHQAVRSADTPTILTLLLDADPAVLNMQDDTGETVLHTACRFNRKKCVELILAQPDLDLNIRTKDGFLPEELTSSKAIRKMVERARALVVVPNKRKDSSFLREQSVADSENSSSIVGSTVNFEKLHDRYEALKNAGDEETQQL